MKLEELLNLTSERDASDLHIICGCAPVLRINGELVFLNEFGKVDANTAKKLAYTMINKEQIEKFEEDFELDFSFGIPDLGRYRVNLHMQRGSIAAAFRRLATQITDVNALGLPEIVNNLAMLEKGMVLVTGATGTGKSTTLAAIVNSINTRRKVHVITIEDPIEYLYSHNKSVIEQREVSSDTKSFASALKYALRQDPDVIMVGEMRDLETISIAITAAETGHLVLGTLHTVDVMQSIDRLIDVFPAHQQQQIRFQISSTLRCVICQQLIPRADKRGRVLAAEVLMVNLAIKNLIRERKTFQIYSELETGSRMGMQTMDMALSELVYQGKISQEDAVLKAHDVESLNHRLKRYML